MAKRSDADLASAFGVPVEIAPFVAELLADLWSLGVPPALVVEILRPLNLPPLTTRVLDLGCGKGAISITLAQELGFKVDGIDFFPPFIEEARKRADILRMSGLCRFTIGDIRETFCSRGDYDIATLIWVGGAIGGPAESVGKLRRMVRQGGHMVYAEGYLKCGSEVDTNGADVTHGGRMSHKEMLDELAAYGDMILREIIIPENQISSLYIDYIHSLRKGAERITLAHPEHNQALKDHIARQEQMCRTLESAVIPAVWLLRKNLP